MEVYHKRHHSLPGEKESYWKHYLFEFLMLFLAVTSGFFVENLREHSSEHKREKQYIRSLVEDLKIDTLQLNAYIRFNTGIIAYCDSLQSDITHKDVFKNSNDFYNYCRELARYVRYYPTDRTMEQLKNAGNMRLITKWNVSNAITEYDHQTRFMTEVDMQLKDENSKYRNLLVEFLDGSSYDQLNRPGSFMDTDVRTKGNPTFITNDERKIKIIYNEAFSLKILFSSGNNSARNVVRQARILLLLLQKEYGIK
ncbi:MAG: hypothetical protein ACHQF0_08790 [Chitinophagales bacterium]